jgi:integrase
MCSPFETSEISVQDYAVAWLQRLDHDLRPKTVKSYEQLYRIHIRPALGVFPIQELNRAKVKLLLTQKRTEGLSKNTVRLIRACLSVMCSEAVDDGLITENPAKALGRPGFRREIRLSTAVRAFAEGELARFLTATKRLWPDYYPLFLTLSRTGCRPGEALALCWPDLDFDERKILVERAFSCGQLGPTKSGSMRYVDISRELASVLRRLYDKRLKEHRKRACGEMLKWVFVNSAGRPIDENRPRKVFAKVLARAGLRNHSVYDLRHTLRLFT